MRSPSPAGWLFRKEWRELLSSRAWWLMLALVGPIVGVSFITAVRTYGEASAGAVTGGGEAFSPLDGIWAPTFGAYELIAIFLLPFVAIRIIGADRQSGALTLELQGPASPVARILVKATILLVACLLAGMAGVIAIGLWSAYGGHTYWPEIAVVAAGHLLNAGLTIALASAAAAASEHPSTAAVVTLGFTVGTWALDFLAAVHGGIWDQVAAYTPIAMVGTFQRGLLRSDLVLIALLLTGAGLGIAAIWTRLGVAPRRRMLESMAVVGVTAALIATAAHVRPSWDLSENRRNSFSESAEAALRRIAGPLAIEAHLAQRDPRRFDLEHHALAKLRRLMPDLQVTYVARTSIGLFEQADEGYGEVRYTLNGRHAVSRMTTSEGVLETLYALAEIEPDDDPDEAYPGHPLNARPVGAPLLFYGVWPAVVAGIGALAGRRGT